MQFFILLIIISVIAILHIGTLFLVLSMELIKFNLCLKNIVNTLFKLYFLKMSVVNLHSFVS